MFASNYVYFTIKNGDKSKRLDNFFGIFSRKNVSVRCEKLAFRASSECTQLFICFVRFVSSDFIHFCCWKQKELFLVIEYCFVYFLNDALLFHKLLFNTLNATKDFYLPTEIFCWSINDFLVVFLFHTENADGNGRASTITGSIAYRSILTFGHI